VWEPPSLLRGSHENRFTLHEAQVYHFAAPNLRESLPIGRDERLQIRGEGTINDETFARAIAKIAYCNAVTKYGLNGFRKLVLPDIILGRYPNIATFIGSEPDNLPPPAAPTELHTVKFALLRREGLLC
jgi:hypothetical protein